MKDSIVSRRKLLRAGLLAGAPCLTGTRLLSATPAAARPSSEPFSFCLNMATIRGQKLGIIKEAEIAARAGYQAIEPWVDSIEQFVQNGGSLDDLKNRIRDLGLTVESAIAFPEWIVDDDSRRAKGMEQARRAMALVAQIGGTRIAAPPAGATALPVIDLERAAYRYRALLELGDRMGVVPQVELWGSSQNLHRLSECAFVAIESGHPKACILADVFHLYKGGSSFESLGLLSAQALQVFHMNDYPDVPAREKINDGYRVFPGEGSAPLQQIVRDLRASGGRKVLSLELFSRKYWEQDPLEVARAGIEKMRRVVDLALAATG